MARPHLLLQAKYTRPAGTRARPSVLTLQASRCIFLRTLVVVQQQLLLWRAVLGFLPAALRDSSSRFRAHGLSIIYIRLKILQSQTSGRRVCAWRRGPLAYSFAHHLQGNRRHTREVVPGQGAIFMSWCPIFDQKSRWLKCTCIQSRSLPHFLKVPLIHLLGGSFSRSLAAWPRHFSGTGEYSGHPGPQCLGEGK